MFVVVVLYVISRDRLEQFVFFPLFKKYTFCLVWLLLYGYPFETLVYQYNKTFVCTIRHDYQVVKEIIYAASVLCICFQQLSRVWGVEQMGCLVTPVA